MRTGSRTNSKLNGIWGKHGRPHGKKRAASSRRTSDKKEIKQGLSEWGDLFDYIKI